MAGSTFRFKEFNVSQDKCAMKVGTDGVLLGAWVRIDPAVESALDIGTGSGLIALQLAQRADCEVIDALEIEDRAFEQAVENFENSPWSDRLFCYHASLEEFRMEMEEGYDLIVCNPPFFNNTYPASEADRNTARHQEELDFQSLLLSTSALLNPGGSCAFVIPFEREAEFLETGMRHGLNPTRLTRVKGSPERPIKRSLLQMTKSEESTSTASSPQLSELILEISRHTPTEEYRNLVQDFYLNM